VRARGRITLTLIAVLSLAVLTATAGASRKPSDKEQRQLAAVINVPPKCAKARVSTLSPKPKWASVTFKPAGPSCESFGSNGVTIAKKKEGVWRMVTAGSDFECGSLYTQVPKAVVEDLNISCR
jgi:hypothetical protein